MSHIDPENLEILCVSSENVGTTSFFGGLTIDSGSFVDVGIDTFLDNLILF